MQVGSLNNKNIELQRETRTADGMGGYTSVWTTYRSAWAKKTTHRSDEAVQAMRQTGKALHNYRIRHYTDILWTDRIKDGDSYMSIVGPPVEVDQDGIRMWLDITAEEAK